MKNKEVGMGFYCVGWDYIVYIYLNFMGLRFGKLLAQWQRGGVVMIGGVGQPYSVPLTNCYPTPYFSVHSLP